MDSATLAPTYMLRTLVRPLPNSREFCLGGFELNRRILRRSIGHHGRQVRERLLLQ